MDSVGLSLGFSLKDFNTQTVPLYLKTNSPQPKTAWLYTFLYQKRSNFSWNVRQNDFSCRKVCWGGSFECWCITFCTCIRLAQVAPTFPQRRSLSEYMAALCRKQRISRKRSAGGTVHAITIYTLEQEKRKKAKQSMKAQKKRNKKRRNRPCFARSLPFQRITVSATLLSTCLRHFNILYSNSFTVWLDRYFTAAFSTKRVQFLQNLTIRNYISHDARVTTQPGSADKSRGFVAPLRRAMAAAEGWAYFSAFLHFAVVF